MTYSKRFLFQMQLVVETHTTSQPCLENKPCKSSIPSLPTKSVDQSSAGSNFLGALCENFEAALLALLLYEHNKDTKEKQKGRKKN